MAVSDQYDKVVPPGAEPLIESGVVLSQPALAPLLTEMLDRELGPVELETPLEAPEETPEETAPNRPALMAELKKSAGVIALTGGGAMALIGLLVGMWAFLRHPPAVDGGGASEPRPPQDIEDLL